VGQSPKLTILIPTSYNRTIKKWRWAMQRVISGFIIFLFSSFLYASDAAQHPLMAFGFYSTLQNKILPLLATSKDQGKTWTYPQDILKMPFEARDYDLDTAGCTQDTCIVAGDAILNSDMTHLLLALTSNQGVNWSYVKTQPDDYVSMWDNIQMSCTDQFCAIASSYTNTSGKILPFLAVSTDKGHTWSYPSSVISELPTKDEGPLFESIDCNSFGICIGIIVDAQERVARYLAIGTHNATQWTYSPITQGGAYPVLSDATCNAKFCIAVGNSLLLTSSNQGKTWSKVAIPCSHDVEFSNVKCHNNVCIMSGSEIIPTSQPYSDILKPFVLMSTDYGKSWKYSASIQNQLPEDLLSNEYNFIDFADCTDKNCIAVGWGFDPRKGNPALLLAISEDHGTTWKYIDPKKLKPADFGRIGELDHVSCTQQTCIATGNYRNAPQDTLQPLMIASHDNGVTWSIPSTITSNLPADYQWGEFINSLTTKTNKTITDLKNKFLSGHFNKH
jgi:hypothetical protein